jgi:hypothetical protein
MGGATPMKKRDCLTVNEHKWQALTIGAFYATYDHYQKRPADLVEKIPLDIPHDFKVVLLIESSWAGNSVTGQIVRIFGYDLEAIFNLDLEVHMSLKTRRSMTWDSYKAIRDDLDSLRFNVRNLTFIEEKDLDNPGQPIYYE